MDTSQIIEIVKATAGETSHLLSQVAWFIAIGQAAQWLSWSFPALLMFSVIMKVSKNTKAESDQEKGTRGAIKLVGWLLLAFTIHTSTIGISHLVKAGLAPQIYVADSLNGLEAIKKVVGK